MTPNDHSVRLAPTFKEGVLVCVGAIADACLVYCGGSCIDEQAHQSIGPHDLGQTLFRRDGRSRLVTTFTDRSMVPFGAATPIVRSAERLLAARPVPLLVVAELAGLTIGGDDLDGIAHSLAERLGIVVVSATARRQARDFQDALSSILAGLARGLPDAAFEGGPVPGRATVVGYLFERREGDHEGNVAELDRMVRDAGLEPTPPWLSGAGYAGLALAARSSLLIALPRGREAARLLAARSGARVLDLDLPVGLDRTVAFVRAVAAAGGTPDRAEAALDRALAAAVPQVDRVASRFLAGRRVALAATPDWLPGLRAMFEADLGLEVALEFLRARFPEDDARDALGQPADRRRHDPSLDSIRAQVGCELAGRGLDLFVGSALERRVLAGDAERIPAVEFGFPSVASHFLHPAPHLGIPGVVTWAERLANAWLDRR